MLIIYGFALGGAIPRSAVVGASDWLSRVPPCSLFIFSKDESLFGEHSGQKPFPTAAWCALMCYGYSFVS